MQNRDILISSVAATAERVRRLEGMASVAPHARGGICCPGHHLRLRRSGLAQVRAAPVSRGLRTDVRLAPTGGDANPEPSSPQVRGKSRTPLSSEISPTAGWPAWNSHDTDQVLALLHPDVSWEETVF